MNVQDVLKVDILHLNAPVKQLTLMTVLYHNVLHVSINVVNVKTQLKTVQNVLDQIKKDMQLQVVSAGRDIMKIQIIIMNVKLVNINVYNVQKGLTIV